MRHLARRKWSLLVCLAAVTASTRVSADVWSAFKALREFLSSSESDLFRCGDVTQNADAQFKSV
jgi:hypothetical protein